MPQQLFLLEFNEVNFDCVAYYTGRGRLPNLKWLTSQGWHTTTSEERYEHLEPWIQWVTAHTSLTLSEHGVFRLGDIVQKDLPQIWELLEAAGLKVGAISPMNAKHRLRAPAFFVPDPWTQTTITAPPVLQRLYGAIAQAVNDNAAAKVTASSLVGLLRGVLAYARLPNYFRYLQLAMQAARRPWSRALFLDLLLADVFQKEVGRTKPDFASLFLNAGAHIQHHYMFSSGAYEGSLKNPAWYAAPGVDPLFEVYELYDHILGTLRSSFPDARFMVATGLHQVPHEQVTFYWRLRDHESFLRKLGLEFASVVPRMSRDFLVVCSDAAQARHVSEQLALATSAADGLRLFEVDNRGNDVFAMLVYPHDIPHDFEFAIRDKRYQGLKNEVVFVALKNGEHDGMGYFFDTGALKASYPEQFPLTELPRVIMRALGAAA